MRTRRLVSRGSLLLLCAFVMSCTRMDGSPNVHPPESALAGTAWALESLNGQPLLAGTTITLEFREGTFGGQSGCNHYGGDYTVTETVLELLNTSSTLMGCDVPVMEQEAAYVRALGGAVTYTLTGERLELVNQENGETLRFIRD